MTSIETCTWCFKPFAVCQGRHNLGALLPSSSAVAAAADHPSRAAAGPQTTAPAEGCPTLARTLLELDAQSEERAHLIDSRDTWMGLAIEAGKERDALADKLCAADEEVERLREEVAARDCRLQELEWGR